MQFDLLRFFRTATKPHRADFLVDLSKGDFPGYRVPKPVSVHFEVERSADALRIGLSFSVSVAAECARCLSPLERVFRVEREFVLKERQLQEQDSDLPMTPDGVLDLDELVFQEVVLEVPPVLLCSPECLGLCPVCGKKKAAGCTCQTADEPAPADPRFGVLKQLLN